MPIRDHVSLAATLAVLFIVLFFALSRLGAEVVVETAPDGVNTITKEVEDGKVVTQSMTTVNVLADYVEGEKSAELITPEVETAAAAMMGPENARAFLHALRLSMRKYDIDMRTQTGRRAWHGQFLREEIHTNDLCKVEVYSNTVDGTVWRYKSKFQPKPMVRKTNRQTRYVEPGLPERLVNILKKRAAEIDQGTVVTNVETTANAPAN